SDGSDRRRGRDGAHEGERRHALPAARFADQTEDAPPVEGEGDPIDGARLAVVGREDHAQVADVEKQRHQPVVAASRGTTRAAEGGANRVSSSGTLRSTEPHASLATDAETSRPCGNPSS